MSKKALITGATGQDASYLAELLLEKGYKVYGTIRRSSTFITERIDHIFNPEDATYLHYADLTDNSIVELIYKIKPDEIYNLAAMSHVRVSFDIPIYTFNTNATGVIRILDGIKNGIKNGILKSDIKFYQASSSEMYGITKPENQNEDGIFHPISPYGIAKLASYWATRAYRDGYNMFASNGILYNHECISPNNVITIKNKGILKICYVKNLKKQHADYATQVSDFTSKDIEIMTSEGFKKIKTLTIRSSNSIKDSTMRCLETRNGLLEITNDHNCLNNKNKKIKTKNIQTGDKLKTCNYKLSGNNTIVSKEIAQFLGYMVADGSISQSKNRYRLSYSKNDDKLRNNVKFLAEKLFLGISKTENTKGCVGTTVKRLCASNISQNTLSYLKGLIYNEDKTKKVPEIILNSNIETMLHFFDAYYQGDGLKKDKCKYKYKAVKSNSPILLQGLYYISQVALKQQSCLYSFLQDTPAGERKRYYALNLNKKDSNRGKHLIKDKTEVTKNNEIKKEKWVYDLETENGEFQLGIGNVIVSNSPRRGERFVTRKIVRAACRIKLGLQKHLTLGNLSALRDWGHSKDYVKAIWMILQADKPDDFVVSTGEYHSVEDFLHLIFKKLDLNIEKHVKYDKRLERPNEVPALLGDSTKIRTELGWKPEYSFDALVEEMITSEMKIQKGNKNEQTA